MRRTVARVRVKVGHLDEVVALMREWDREMRPKVDGAAAANPYRLDRDPNETFRVVVLRDRTSYPANADNPEQDRFFRRVSEHFKSAPEWNDGEIVCAS